MTNDSSANGRELRPVPRYEWEQIIRRARVSGLITGTGRVGKTGLPTRGGVGAAMFKGVAMTLASYGNPDGTEVFPGDATVAVDLECAISTVKQVRQTLLRLGLLQRVAGRLRNRQGEEYRLTLPTDLMDILDVPSPAAQKMAARRLQETTRGKTKNPAPGVSTGPPEPTPQPVDNIQRGYPVDPPNSYPQDMLGVSTGPPKDLPGVSSGPRSGYPVDPRTQPLPHLTTTTQPLARDVDVKVTAPRDPAPEKPDISPQSDQPPTVRAIGVARVPRPTRCPHGQPLTHRPDLTPRCTLCHRTATLTEPTGPLALVIPLHPRTA